MTLYCFPVKGVYSPNIDSMFTAFFQSFNWDALMWLSVESYLLLWTIIFWVTLGLVKTVGNRGIDIGFYNETTKYSLLFVLLSALSLGISRNLHITNSTIILNEMFISDNWTNWSQIGIVVLTIVFVVLTDATNFTRNSYYYEFLLFTLTSSMLMCWLVATWNFITFYLVLEGLSLVFYVVATRTLVFGGILSGLKYYSLGALASVILLSGLVSIFAAIGSLDFSVTTLVIKEMLTSGQINILLAMGLTLVMLSLFFKLSAFPAHVWTPDVYEGTTLEVLWIFAVISKLALFLVFMRMTALFFIPALSGNANFWIATSCLGSLVIGAVGAFLATSVKRFLAYTAINQMGFLFIGLTAASFDGFKSVIAYLYIYMLANILFFGVVTLLQSKKLLVGGSSLRSLKDMSLIKKAPIEMGLASIALLSLGGLPPLAGFVGKYQLWVSLINKYVNDGPIGLHENLIYILVASVILSLLSTFYYLRLIKMALFDTFEKGITPPVEIRNGLNITSSISIVAFFGAFTIGWVLMLPNLDVIWSRITMSLSANFTNLGVL